MCALTAGMVPVVLSGGTTPTIDTVDSVMTMVGGNVGIGATSLTLTNSGPGTIAAAITALGSPASGYVINLIPGTYIEDNLTFPAVPVTINGNGATIVTANGAGTGTITFPKQFHIKQTTIVGNLVQSSTDTTIFQRMESITLLGNLTTYGFINIFNSWLTGNGTTNSVITINSPSLTVISSTTIGAPETGYYSRILINGGQLAMDLIDIFTNDNVNYCVDASTSGSALFMNFGRVYNYGTGGGVSVYNNSSSVLLSNDLSNMYIYLAGASNGIVAGTAYLSTVNYTLIYNFLSSPTIGYATGTNIGGRGFGKVYVAGLGYLTGGVVTDSTGSLTLTAAQIATNSIFQETGSTAATFTLDTGSNLSAAISNVTVGLVVDFSVTNSSTQTITMASATGATLANAMTVATLQSRVFRAINTGTNTWTIY